jgi:hypothetical protein
MTDTTYEKVPLGPPSPRPLATPESPKTPETLDTPVFKKERPKKRTTVGYVPSKQELDEDPLERLQKNDYVCAILGLYTVAFLILNAYRNSSDEFVQ